MEDDNMVISPIMAHIIGAVIMTVPWCIIGIPLVGVAVSTTFYYSRELSQYQTKRAQELGVYRSTLWYIVWPKGHEKEFVLPAIVSGLIGTFFEIFL